MSSSSAGQDTVRFLTFSNVEEDEEKKAKLQEAAARIEQAIARDKAISELVDYKPPDLSEASIDPAKDCRPLYERLLDQQNKKKEAFEEAHKLSNLVAKFDEDDISHLNDVAKQKYEQEIKKRLEVQDLVEEQKQLMERKIVEDEKKRKESLLGLRKGSVKPVCNLNSLKSKLSQKIKMKSKSPGKSPSCSPVKEPSVSTKEVVSPGAEHQEDQKTAKRLRVDDESRGSIDSNDVRSTINFGIPSATKCIGILPASYLVKCQPKENDSDDSDDDLDTRIVPRLHSTRK